MKRFDLDHVMETMLNVGLLIAWFLAVMLAWWVVLKTISALGGC